MKLHEFFDRPEKWTKYIYAKDSAGKSVDPHDHDAVCFCLLGACNHLGLDSQEICLKLQPYFPTRINLTYINDYYCTTFGSLRELLLKADV